MKKRERSWRYDYISQISNYFNKSNEDDVSKLLLENSADSFRTSLEQYKLNHPLNSNYKYSILLLDHSIEALLKACLAVDSKLNILKREDTSKIIQTIGIQDCIYKLQEIDKLQKRDIILEDNFINAILDLHAVRNDVWHLGFLGNKNLLDRLISYCSCVYWALLMIYLPEYGIRSMLTRQQFETLLSFEGIWHFVKYSAARIIYEWEQTLDIEQERYFLRHCKECLNQSIIVDRNSGSCKCRCCGQKYKFSDFVDK